MLPAMGSPSAWAAALNPSPLHKHPLSHLHDTLCHCLMVLIRQAGSQLAVVQQAAHSQLAVVQQAAQPQLVLATSQAASTPARRHPPLPCPCGLCCQLAPMQRGARSLLASDLSRPQAGQQVDTNLHDVARHCSVFLVQAGSQLALVQEGAHVQEGHQAQA